MAREENEKFPPKGIQYLDLLLMDNLNDWNLRLGLTQHYHLQVEHNSKKIVQENRCYF